MVRLLFYIVCFVLFLYSAPAVHAVIIFPALVLIPVIKIVAVVIGALSLPAVGLAALWRMLFGTSPSRLLMHSIGILFIIAVGIIIGSIIFSPDRPFF